MKKLTIFLLFTAILLSMAIWVKLVSPDNITITLWHTYVEDMRIALDELIMEFNYTVGAENGITVKVTSITDARIVNEQLVAAANDDPGAPELPDMAVIYPQIAVTLAEKGVLVDLGQYIQQTELDAFVPQFIEEGRFGGDKLYLMPIAKSVEVLYVNRTHYDRFSNETGIGIDKLSSFEGIAEAAAKYYEWSGGKMFFYPEGLFNQAMVGFQQLGGNIVKDNRLNLSDQVFNRIWDSYYIPAVKGGVIIYNGWGNYLAATGDVVCATASSAGSTFYPSQIIYADNTKEDVVFDVLPYPVFMGGENVDFQRGGGVCVTKSNLAREKAASAFLNWLTEAKRNLNFCASIGYIPVRKASFEEIMTGNFPAISNPIAEKALLTAAAMQKDYRFYFPHVFNGYDSLQTQYTDRLRKAAQDGRDVYLQLLQTQDTATAFNIASNNAMENYISRFAP